MVRFISLVWPRAILTPTMLLKKGAVVPITLALLVSSVLPSVLCL